MNKTLKSLALALGVLLSPNYVHESQGYLHMGGLEKTFNFSSYQIKPEIKYHTVLEEKLYIPKEEAIDSNFINSIIKVESNGNPYAVGTSGERGLMQLMRDTWELVSNEPFSEAFNSEKNIKYGTKYLKAINKEFEEAHPDWDDLPVEFKRKLLAAAYNGGPGRLKNKNWQILKMPSTTRVYVKRLEHLGAFYPKDDYSQNEL